MARDNIPEPAPVTIADLPLTERAMMQVRQEVGDCAGPRRKSTALYAYGLVELRSIIAAHTIAVLEKRGTPRRGFNRCFPGGMSRKVVRVGTMAEIS